MYEECAYCLGLVLLCLEFESCDFKLPVLTLFRDSEIIEIEKVAALVWLMNVKMDTVLVRSQHKLSISNKLR